MKNDLLGKIIRKDVRLKELWQLPIGVGSLFRKKRHVYSTMMLLHQHYQS